MWLDHPHDNLQGVIMKRPTGSAAMTDPIIAHNNMAATMA